LPASDAVRARAVGDFQAAALIARLDRLESVADVRELTDFSPPANSGA
jgi:hypothetical protein